MGQGPALRGPAAQRRGAAALSRPDLLRLQRLAKEAGTTPARILKSVLRDGFEYTEWFVRQVNEGEADLKAGRVMSTAEVLAQIERQRACRGRRSAAA
ncbi:MAG: hypothetical protein ABI423_00345 [Burkholderiales bacterium]